MWWRRIDAFVRRQNPWIGFILAAASIFVTIYLALPEKGVLGYRQSVIKIFDSRSAGTLRLVEPNSQPIEGDVYAVETTLRNAGNWPSTRALRAASADLSRSDFRKARLSRLG